MLGATQMLLEETTSGWLEGHHRLLNSVLSLPKDFHICSRVQSDLQNLITLSSRIQ